MCCRREHSRIHSLACIPLLPLLGFPGSSAGKEFAGNAGDPGSISGLGRSPAEATGYPLQYSWDSLVAQRVKDSACNAGGLGSIPGLGRSLGGGHGNPLQYSCASLVVQLVKESTCNVGDLGSIPGLGRSSGEGKGYPLQCSGLKNPGLQRAGHS